MNATPIVKDLVLVGGGHSHVEVLRSFGMRPLAGVRLTLVTRDMHTPYSGMLPGYVSGFYSYDECHIDLCRLAAFARARLIHCEATGIDPRARRVRLAGRPSVHYDLLSLDVGITPAASSVPGAAQHTTPVKPIDRFVERFEALLARVRESPKPLSVVVVGGGAGGAELAFALHQRLEAERVAAERPEDMRASVTLVSRGPLLASHPPYARSALLRAAAARPGLQVLEGAGVERVQAGLLHLEAGGRLAFDACLWCTQAAAASWLRETGLPVDAQGFLAINQYLQSDGGPPDVFAAGDCATSTSDPRPKAGVFAVRQGPVLAANLAAALTARPLTRFTPQTSFLGLITTGGRHAIGTRGWLAFEGGYAWQLKDWIDRGFMDKYGAALPFEMMAGAADARGGGGGAGAPPALAAAGPEALALLAAAKMRCGGCGAKVGASTLARALARLRRERQQPQQRDELQQQPHLKQQQQQQQQLPGICLGLDSPDDAALVEPPPPGSLLVQTLDFFRAFWDDPYVLGRVAANHALGDVWAMGASPMTALAVAVVPYSTEAQQEEELFQMLAGATSALDAAGCALVGGHSSEGAELSLGFSVSGFVQRGAALTKAGLAPGQALLLTKGLGTGALLAAAMRGRARGRWVAAALAAMQQASGDALRVLLEHGVAACTDVTGFGLLGHLGEMAVASQVTVELDLDTLPSLPGALDCIAAGALSSLHAQNSRAAALVTNFGALGADPRWPLLVDPQTAGGLLAAVPGAQAASAVAALRRAGYADAAVVGRVVGAAADGGSSGDDGGADGGGGGGGRVPLISVVGCRSQAVVDA